MCNKKDPREIFRNYAEVFVVDGIEFIRKDFLVDWLKRKQDTTLIVVEDDLIQELIDHINEM